MTVQLHLEMMFGVSTLLRKTVLNQLTSKTVCDGWIVKRIVLSKGENSLYQCCSHLRRYSSDEKHEKGIAKSERRNEVSTTMRTVKETTKTATYTGVILIGLSVTGCLFYFIFRELFSSTSPNTVYSNALERCINDNRIKDSLGEPIKGYGEETRRGRRRHVSHLLYEKFGVNYLRMKFYLQGVRRKATVHLEMKENNRGKYEYRYLFVQLDDFPNTTFVLEDNRLDTVETLYPVSS